ncbi:MAG: WD40 repeat domain-containing protein [Planctomycetaceae bacterium]
MDERGQMKTGERSVVLFDFAWHPDGTQAFISQSDGVWRWEPATGQRKRLFEFSASAGYDDISEQRFAIASLTDPSGKTHAMGHKSLFKSARIEPGRDSVLMMFRNAFSPLTISRSGKRAVVANQVWNAADWNEPGKPLWQSDSSDQVIAKFAQDNHVCVARDRVLQIFDVTSGRLAAQAINDAMITSLDVTADGQRALTGDILGHVRLWDLGQQKVVAKFDGHVQTVTTVAFTPDGTHALSGGQDKTVRLWELPKPPDAPTPLPVAPIANAEARWIAPIPANAALPQLADAPPFAAAKRLSSLPTVQVHVTADGARAMLRIPDHSSPSDTKVIRGLPGARIKEKIIVGLGGPPVPGAVEVWDIKNNERLGEFTKPAIVGATLSADGSRVLIVRGGFLSIGDNASQLMQVWNVEKQNFANDPAPWTAQERSVMENLYIDSSGGTPLSAFDNLTRMFAAKDRSLFVFDTSELTTDKTEKARKNVPPRVRRMENPSARGSVEAILSQAKSDLIVLGWSDGLIDVLQGKTGKLVAEFSDFGRPVSLTSDGRFLLTMQLSADNGRERETTVRLCQTTDGQEVTTLKLPGEYTLTAAVLPHANYALIGHADGTLGLWDLNGGKLLGRVKEHSQAPQIAISADGQHALTASAGGAWHLDLSAVQEPPPRELLPKKPASSKPKNAAVKPTKKK